MSIPQQKEEQQEAIGSITLLKQHFVTVEVPA